MPNSNHVELTVEDLKIFSKLTGITIADDRIENTIKDVKLLKFKDRALIGELIN